MFNLVESLAELKTHQHRAIWRQRLVEAVRNRTRELEKGRSTGMKRSKTMLVGRGGEMSVEGR